MNYRHAFHAGNFADVVKHLVLTHVIAHLCQKPAPFRIIDTHAGAGIYDLCSDAATRTGEWYAGIGRLMGAELPAEVDEVLRPYLDLLSGDIGPDGRLARYPGSPLIARRLMRPGDVLIANELHAEDREHLADLFHRDAQVKVMGLDGYTALKALLPPKERRGVVLVDPPFEVAGEFQRLARAVSEAHRRFATGILILWYPIKDRAAVTRLHGDLRQSGVARALCAELSVAASGGALEGLTSTGLVVVNPPYRLDEKLAVALPHLAALLAQGPGGGARVEWLIAEPTA